MNRPKLTSRDDAGIRKLAGAVLLQTIEDLNEGDPNTRAEAWQWLTGKNEAGFSFALCCKVLGYNAEDVRRGLLPGAVAAEQVVVPDHLPLPVAELAEQFAG